MKKVATSLIAFFMSIPSHLIAGECSELFFNKANFKFESVFDTPAFTEFSRQVTPEHVTMVRRRVYELKQTTKNEHDIKSLTELENILDKPTESLSIVSLVGRDEIFDFFDRADIQPLSEEQRNTVMLRLTFSATAALLLAQPQNTGYSFVGGIIPSLMGIAKGLSGSPTLEAEGLFLNDIKDTIINAQFSSSLYHVEYVSYVLGNSHRAIIFTITPIDFILDLIRW